MADIQGSLIYQPEAGRYYVWTEGQAKTSTTLNIYEQRSFNLIGWDWDFLVPDTAAKLSDTRYTDGAPLLESELVYSAAEVAKLIHANPNSLPPVFVQYMQKRNAAVDMVKDKSLVRDVRTNKLYT